MCYGCSDPVFKGLGSRMCRARPSLFDFRDLNPGSRLGVRHPLALPICLFERSLALQQVNWF